MALVKMLRHLLFCVVCDSVVESFTSSTRRTNGSAAYATLKAEFSLVLELNDMGQAYTLIGKYFNSFSWVISRRLSVILAVANSS